MTSKCFLLSRKVCLPVQNSSFCPKLRYFTDQNGPKDDHMKMNFDYSHIKWWLLQIVRVEKVDEKNEIICLVSTFSSWVMVLKLFKKVHFMQFCAELSNLSLWKQFPSMHLKFLITLFQKLVCFIRAWNNIHEILAIKKSKKMLTQQKLNKFFWLQTLISLKQ